MHAATLRLLGLEKDASDSEIEIAVLDLLAEVEKLRENATGMGGGQSLDPSVIPAGGTQVIPEGKFLNAA